MPKSEDVRPGSPLLYAKIGTQYYVAGRAAVFREHYEIAGNLFHHGFEMLLKAALYFWNQCQPDKLQKIGHNLPRLWKEAKSSGIFGIDLSGFDGFMVELGRWEEIRYGGFSQDKPIRLIVEMRREALPEPDTTFDEYVLVVDDADALFEQIILRGIGGNIPYKRSALVGSKALRDYELDNRHVIR
jgi:hypothetical protein